MTDKKTKRTEWRRERLDRCFPPQAIGSFDDRRLGSRRSGRDSRREHVLVPDHAHFGEP